MNKEIQQIEKLIKEKNFDEIKKMKIANIASYLIDKMLLDKEYILEFLLRHFFDNICCIVSVPDYARVTKKNTVKKQEKYISLDECAMGSYEVHDIISIINNKYIYCRERSENKLFDQKYFRKEMVNCIKYKFIMLQFIDHEMIKYIGRHSKEPYLAYDVAWWRRRHVVTGLYFV